MCWFSCILSFNPPPNVRVILKTAVRWWCSSAQNPPKASCLTQKKSQVLATSHGETPVISLTSRVSYVAAFQLLPSSCAALSAAPPMWDAPSLSWESHHVSFLLSLSLHKRHLLCGSFPCPPGMHRASPPPYLLHSADLLSIPTLPQPVTHLFTVLVQLEWSCRRGGLCFVPFWTPQSRTAFLMKHPWINKWREVFFLPPFYSWERGVGWRVHLSKVIKPIYDRAAQTVRRAYQTPSPSTKCLCEKYFCQAHSTGGDFDQKRKQMWKMTTNKSVGSQV